MQMPQQMNSILNYSVNMSLVIYKNDVYDSI